MLGWAAALDPERRVVEVESDAGRVGIAYADLVIALGAVTGASPMPSRLGLPCDDRNRLRIDEVMRVVGARNIWALGDCAAVPDTAAANGADPPACRHAIDQARHLAANLRGTPSPYRCPRLHATTTQGCSRASGLR